MSSLVITSPHSLCPEGVYESIVIFLRTWRQLDSSKFFNHKFRPTTARRPVSEIRPTIERNFERGFDF